MDLIICNNSICYHDAEKARFVRRAHPIGCSAVHPEMYIFFGGMSSSAFVDYLLTVLTTLFEPVQDVPNSDDPSTWSFHFSLSWFSPKDDVEKNRSKSSKECLARIKEMALKLAEPFCSAVLWMPDDTKVSFDRMVYWVMQSILWHLVKLSILSLFGMKLNMSFQFVVKDSTTPSKMHMILLKL
jgi:hypothetical protein